MIVTRAPLRIPLGGGGTDLPSYYSEYGGFILSVAINKYVFINLNCLPVDDSLRILYSRSEIVTEVEEIRHPLVRESLKWTGVDGGLEIASMADVPSGTGMGSSGSYLVALLIALHALKREHIPTQELAEEACTIEIELAGQPVGKHDQYLAAFGGIICLDIETDGRVTVSPLRISPYTLEELRNSTLLFYTGIIRRSFDILDAQKKDTERGDKRVVESLHLTKELGLEIKKALESGDLNRFGELLDVHWQNKKKRSGKISAPQIDHWYDLARQNGALGGKLVGAGGGGFFMFLCPNNHKAQLREVMAREGLREMPYDFDLEGAKLLVNF